MKDYASKRHYESRSPVPLIIVWIGAAYLIANMAWEQVFNYFGF